MNENEQWRARYGQNAGPGNPRVRRLVESRAFQRGIMAVIFLNAVIIGFQTTHLPPDAAHVLHLLDDFCLVVYVVEAALKLSAWRLRYFRDGWNVFDFVIVALSLIPAGLLPIPFQVARVIRVFRAFRVFRLISAFRQMRVIIEAIIKSLPGVAWTAGLLLIIYYVFAVIGVTLFGASHPEYFGNLGRAVYTLFQIMTLESWSHGIARPVMTAHPLAWLYFVPFVCCSTFIMLNVVVGLVVSSIDETQASLRKDEGREEDPCLRMAEEIGRIRAHLDVIEKMLAETRTAAPPQKPVSGFLDNN